MGSNTVLVRDPDSIWLDPDLFVQSGPLKELCSPQSDLLSLQSNLNPYDSKSVVSNN
jgi:hypothetical protein